MKKNVLVNYVEAGMGHITAAMSIAESLKRYHDNTLNIKDAHIFRDSGNKALVDFEKYISGHTKSYSKNKYASDIHHSLMEMVGPQRTLKLAHDLWMREAKKASIDYYRKESPDIIVTTFFSDAYFAKCYQKKFNKECKVVTYNPDPDVHGWWYNETDCFIVNNPVAYKQAIERGFPEENVKQVPFIMRSDIINLNLSKKECREKHGIPQDKFVTVLSDSVYGAAKLGIFTDELLKTSEEMVIMPAVCRNEDLMTRYTDLATKQPANIDLIPIGFRFDLFEFFKAADVVVAKSGPNTLLDCGFMGTPVIVNHCATPTEKFSRDLFVHEYGVGESIDDPVACRKRLETFVANPGLLGNYQENARKRFDPTKTGGQAIADIICDLAYN